MDYSFVEYGLILVIIKLFRPQALLGWKSQMQYKISEQVKSRLDSAAVLPGAEQ